MPLWWREKCLKKVTAGGTKMIDEEDATTNRLLEQFAMHMKDISSVERRCKVTVGV